MKHQRNMQHIADALGIPLIKLAASNAIFGRSESLAKMHTQTGFSVDEWWQACWPVHQSLLARVRPRLIITLGHGEHSSAFGLLRKEAGYLPVRAIGEQGKSGGKTFDSTLPLGGADNIQVSVVGVPHPSWYAAGPILKHQLRELASGMTP